MLPARTTSGSQGSRVHGPSMAVHTVGYDERDHLFHLAGEEPARRGTTCAHVSPGLLLVLDRLHDTPAQVLTDCGDVLAQNARARAPAGDALTHPPRYRNLARRFFLDPAAHGLFSPRKTCRSTPVRTWPTCAR
ncbi:hypothetical protein GCM10010094_52980 [Streptomyces flaveus]|uniref:MmyB-like transcription regulator ligand binding domain-containing protein n=1 Tax=Streptomyces flaveus TaxID=66370 RepID=A0A917VI00_9ACTN|nr:hypothetical protein GCM10010094_52980 [Streptomyces flaveus]